ncbi:conserved hypothetical protein [Ricinus communis]|uniref:Uncharacterized protein n=1 Tax=Ricinus communis TaxID=3988 RepID=B9SIX7_RICCO|nr:conserved hypothetical protein [Ricinus communis]
MERMPWLLIPCRTPELKSSRTKNNSLHVLRVLPSMDLGREMLSRRCNCGLRCHGCWISSTLGLAGRSCTLSTEARKDPT